MKRNILIILLLCSWFNYGFSQEAKDLSKIEKMFKKKYADRKGSYISFSRVSQYVGQKTNMDSITFYFGGKGEDFYLYFLQNEVQHLIKQDTLYHKYLVELGFPSEKGSFTKFNKRWIRTNNIGNPYYDSYLFFKEISESEVLKDGSNSGYLVLNYEDENKYEIRKLTYTLSLKDTSIVKYSIQSTSKIQSWYHSFEYYPTDLNRIKKNIETYFDDTKFNHPSREKRKPIVEVNDIFPEYSYMNLKGDTVSLKAERSFILLDFWYIGCRPCVLSIDDLNRIMRTIPM